MHRSKAPKKSETLEIRLPYAAKQAFMARCRAEGRTASEAVREFIDGQIDPGPARLRRRIVRLSLGGAAIAAVAAVAAPSLARPTVEANFQQLDRNGDRGLSFVELSAGAAVQVAVGRARTVAVSQSKQETDQDRLRVLVLQTVFRRLDADRDGVISLEEYRRSDPEVRADATADRNAGAWPRSRA